MKKDYLKTLFGPDPEPLHPSDKGYKEVRAKNKKHDVAKKMPHDATKSKHWQHFVNVYRRSNGSNEGLDSPRVRGLSDRELKQAIDSHNRFSK